MSNRKPDDIDDQIMGAIRALGLLGNHLSEQYQRDPSRRDRAESYRRVGQMLEAIADNVRDPLFVALWERTGTGSNVRIQWWNELTRRELAIIAVYLLVKQDGQKLASACKRVAKLTGENFETLRKPFKGLSVPDYERSQAGAHTMRLLGNVRDRVGGEL